MAKIPLSQRQHAPTVVREPRGDVAGAGAQWRAVAQASQALGGMAERVNQFKKRKDDLSTINGEVQRKSRVATYDLQVNELIKSEAHKKGADLTEDEIFKLTEPLRGALNDELANNVYPQIKDARVLAEYNALDVERDGKYGSMSSKINYEKHRTSFHLTNLKTNGIDLIYNNNYAGAVDMLETTRKTIGEEEYIQMLDLFDTANDKMAVQRYSSGETVEELDAQAELIDKDETIDDKIKGSAKKANRTAKKQIKAEKREFQRENEVEFAAKLAVKQLSIPEIRKGVEDETISKNYGTILEAKANKDMQENIPQKAKTKLQAFQRQTQHTPKKLYDLEKSLSQTIDDIHNDKTLNEDQQFYQATTAVKLYGMASNPKIGRDLVASVQRMMDMENFIHNQGVEVESGWSAYSFMSAVTPDMDQATVQKATDDALVYLNTVYQDAAVMAMGKIDVGAEVTPDEFQSRFDTPPVEGARRGVGQYSNTWYIEKDGKFFPVEK